MENLKFEDMNLSSEICRAVLDMGFEEATPIQSQAISIIMEGISNRNMKNSRFWYTLFRAN